jgi:hypothetical protein
MIFKDNWQMTAVGAGHLRGHAGRTDDRCRDRQRIDLFDSHQPYAAAGTSGGDAKCLGRRLSMKTSAPPLPPARFF